MTNEMSDEKYLLQEYIWARTDVEKLEEELAQNKEKLDKAQSELHEYLIQQGASKTAKYDGLGSYAIKEPSLYASCLKENEEMLFDFVKSQDRTDLIKPQIHHRSLASFVKELKEEGKEIPEFIKVYYKLSGIYYKGE